MAQSYKFYQTANLTISFGIVLCVLLVVIYLYKSRREQFYVLIEQMFGIKGIVQRRNTEIGTNAIVHEKLDLFEAVIDIHSITSKVQTFFIWFSLCFTTAMVIAATLIVFVDGIILNVIYLKVDSNCPSNGNMDCYMTRRGSSNHTYFFCNSSDTQFPQYFGSVTCYRWWKDSLSTVDVLNQIGLCTGVIQAFGWIVYLYFHLLIWAAARSPTATLADKPAHLDLKNYAHPCIIICCVFFSIASPLICVIVLTELEISVTGITMAVLCAGIVVAATMVILIIIWRAGIDERVAVVAAPPPELSSSLENARSPSDLRESIILNQTQPASRSTRTKISRIFPVSD